MNIKEQVDAIVEKHKDTTCLEVIRLDMEKLDCTSIVFWGKAPENTGGNLYEIAFVHASGAHVAGPYQFAEKKTSP
jgi:hypothetical protein